jgi:catechol 2,3-dioxygenase-like lactoylglutathione lyase family enzyme
MAYRINHIHLKATDPRRTADWYVGAFGFKIVNDETRVFGDRFVRCQSADGGMAVNISGPRTNETLQPGKVSGACCGRFWCSHGAGGEGGALPGPR